jgi:ADP-heptose:LPS heptosyltransferase
MDIALMRKVDRHAGILFIRLQNLLRREKRLSDQADPKRILIIKLFGLGNFIFLSPTLKALHQAFPRSQIEVLTFRQNLETCQMYKRYISKIHTIDFTMMRMGPEILRFALKERSRFDMVIDFEQFVRLSAIIGRMLKPKIMIGSITKKSFKQPAYDRFLYYKENKHIVEEYYDIARMIAKEYGKSIDEKPFLEPPAFKETDRTHAILKGLKGKRIIGVCPGGRAEDTGKRYPIEMYSELLNRIAASRKDAAFIFIGSKSEKKHIDEIISRMDNKQACISTSGISLNETTALLSKMSLLISNDTGPIHIAAALGIYCVGFFGPSKELIYSPYTEKKLILRHKSHPPVWSCHNEKIQGWPTSWWPSPELSYKRIMKVIENNRH